MYLRDIDKESYRELDVDAERCKDVTVAGVDKVLNIRPWLSGITPEQRAVLMAHRQAAISNPQYISLILPYVGPFERQAQEVHDKMMEEFKENDDESVRCDC